MHGIGAIILAAGGSSRLGQSKQLLTFRGKSLIRRAIDAAEIAGCDPIVVVVGADEEAVRTEVMQKPVHMVENANWQNGLGTSVRAGVRALTERESVLDSIVLLACDQPFVDGDTIRQLIELGQGSHKHIVASAYSDTLGIPALFDRSCFEELLRLEDQSGAKTIIMSDPLRVAKLSFPKGSVDIDTMADYEALRER